MIDTSTNSVIRTITSTPFGSIGCPEGIAVTPDGTRIYLNTQCAAPPGRSGHDPIFAIDTETDTVTTGFDTIPNVGTGLGVNPNGNQIWASGGDACSSTAYDRVGCDETRKNPVHVINPATNTVIARFFLGVGWWYGFHSFSPDGRFAYYAGDSGLVVVDTTTFNVVRTLGISTTGSVAFTADGALAYTTIPSLNAVAVIDPATYTLVAAIPVGITPTAIAITTFEGDENKVIPEMASAQAGGATWITVSSPFRGDANGNSYTVYEYSTSGSGPWTRVCGDGAAGESAWRHCAFGDLTPNRDYFVRVTFADPDGIVGTNPQILGPVRTPATAVAAVTVGTASASVQDKHILVSVPISQDSNLNSRLQSVEIGTSISGPWTQKCGPYATFNPKLCRLAGLTQNTDYWVRATITDPDGVNGPNPQIIGPVRYTGLTNLALGKPITADPGWGCCPDPRELVDGRIQNPDWTYGFAWAGGTCRWGGGSPGWKQATIDLGSPQPVGRVDWWSYSPEHPTTWKVSVSTDGSTYAEVFSATELRCRTETQQFYPGAYWVSPACGFSAKFGPVTARYVRYSFDDRTTYFIPSLGCTTHVWATELEVYSAP